MMSRFLSCCFATLMVFLPAIASADIASIWVAAKGSHIKGTGSVFENNINKDIALGVEAGAELMNLEFMAEAFLLGDDQYVFTGNFGMDFGLELGVRASVGAYLGAIVVKMPKPTDSGFTVPPEVESVIMEDAANALEAAYATSYGEQASELGQWAVGVGPRVRLQLDYAIVPMVYIGAEGSFGYHYMLGGNDLVAEAKGRAIDQAIADVKSGEDPSVQAAIDEQVPALKAAAGAESLGDKELSGTNYNVGIYLKIDLGI